MSDLLILTTSPFGWACLVSIFGICGLTAYVAVALVVSFIVNQAKLLARLYGEMVPAEVALHPYTRSIVENRAPELAELKKYKSNPEAFNECLDGMIYAVEAKEKNKAVRNQLVSKLQKMRKA
jgi:hypothetical protein